MHMGLDYYNMDHALGFFLVFSSTKHKVNFQFRNLSFTSQWTCFNVLKVTIVRLCHGRQRKC